MFLLGLEIFSPVSSSRYPFLAQSEMQQCVGILGDAESTSDQIPGLAFGFV